MINTNFHLMPVHLRSEIQEDAWYCIDEFFGYTSLEEWRHWLHNWFAAAFDEAFILQELPGDFLYAIDKLHLLLYGCMLLAEQPPVTGKVRGTTPASVKRRETVIKHLSLAEAMQPAAVINAFFAFRDMEAWLLTIQLWKEAALGKTSVIETEESSKLMPVTDHLYKLAEAAYIVWQNRLT